MCTPQPVQAWRWMVALLSTTFSFSGCAVTCTLSRATTATWANKAPLGFQHLVQPQAWLWAVWAEMVTSTWSLAQWQRSLPPEKPGLAGGLPASIAGWMDTKLLMGGLLFLCGKCVLRCAEALQFRWVGRGGQSG